METEKKTDFRRRKATMLARLKATKQRVRELQGRVDELADELQLTRAMRDSYKESYDFATSLNDKLNGRIDKMILLLDKSCNEVAGLKAVNERNGEFKEKFEIEKNAKNKAYYFIISNGSLKQYLEFCEDYKGDAHRDCVKLLSKLCIK